MDKKMWLVPEASIEKRTVLETTTLPLFEGKGATNYLCGNCGAILVKNVQQKQIKNLVFKCPICKFFNEIPV